jgi:hypothetical protein
LKQETSEACKEAVAHRFEVGEGFIAEVVFAKVFPDVLYRVQFRTVRRQEE